MNSGVSIVETVHYKYNANKGMIVGILRDVGYRLVCFWSVFWWANHLHKIWRVVLSLN